MTDQKDITRLNGCGNAVGGVRTSTPVGGEHLTPLPNFDNWRRLDTIVIDVIKGLKNAPKA